MDGQLTGRAKETISDLQKSPPFPGFFFTNLFRKKAF
jgi:hypothetical protein